jgi:RHS repeat-associated protein
LAEVSDGTNSATYSHLANSPLVGEIVFNHGGTTEMTTTKSYDNLNRLTGIVNGNGTIPAVDSRAYGYNLANQRTNVAEVDGTYWVYTYDNLGQVTGGVKHWSDGSVVAGQQFGYTFDTIGNRTGTEAGGDQTGANLRPASYGNNALNQITNRTVSGVVDVMGLTLPNDTVNVNGVTAYQKYEYFRQPVTNNNTSAAQWVGITVSNVTQTVSGHQFLPQTPEAFTYDLDGNLTQDGRWTYTWDAENRLINMTSLSSGPSGSLLELAFTYDYIGRRVQKIVSTNSSGSYTAQYTNNFVYDGWNPVVMVNQANSLVASFVWGLDLSGSMEGAGGVGGLLMENLVGNGSQFDGYDGNGNVIALVSAINGTATANYEYGPFGEELRMSGATAKLNPIRFSSKYDDDESDFLYYGYRYYNPSTGRWLSRDSIEEQGGLNLYGFVSNAPINNNDSYGCAVAQNGYVTVNDPVPETCGDFDPWNIIWLLPAPAKQGGLVIQEITMSWTASTSFGNIVGGAHYYEAIGTIPANSSITRNFIDDTWYFYPSTLLAPPSSGQYKVTGVARFYDNGNWAAPAGWQPNPFSGIAPASPNPPQGPQWNNPQLVATRNLTATWDCPFCGYAGYVKNETELDYK